MQLLLYVIIAIAVGLIVAALFRFKVPGGATGLMIAGLLGAWIGSLVIREIGPTIGGYHIFPGVLGAFIVAIIISLLGRRAKVTR